jgi:Cys-tRNA(Pro)/Cys-tRNA(Cys) deacylase
MTPAINLAKKLKIVHAVHEYAHDPNSNSYGLEAAEKLQVDPERVFKTLIVKMDTGELVVAVLPVSSMLSMKLVAKAAGAKKAEMAPKPDAERSSGYVLGGISPLGQRKKLKTVIHASAQSYPTVYVSAGRRGLEIELSPDDLRKAVDGMYTEICQ